MEQNFPAHRNREKQGGHREAKCYNTEMAGIQQYRPLTAATPLTQKRSRSEGKDYDILAETNSVAPFLPVTSVSGKVNIF